MKLRSALLFSAFGVLAAGAAIIVLDGCSTLTKGTEAEESYKGELAKCAATEPSREAVDACKQRVRDRWMVADGAVIAAKDGAL